MLEADSPATRLQKAREAAGYRSALQFCRQNSINHNTYYAHEAGTRQFNAETAARYAVLLKVSPATILYGTELHPLQAATIVGVIRAGGTIEAMHPQVDTIAARYVGDLVGELVQGNDLYPAYRDGDVVYHRPLCSEELDLHSIHGKECVVRTGDGRTLLRQVTVQKDGRVTLIAYSAPPMFDVDIIAAARVELVRRAD